jgi:phosphoribosylglycinamide formyltransferase-1
MTEKLPVAVLISGGGTNLQALLDACQVVDYPAEIKVVLSNKADAYGLKRAEQAGVPCLVVPHQDYPDRQSHERAMLAQMESYAPKIVLLAGYMRVLTHVFIDHFTDKKNGLPGVLNIHPADTRAYQGAHGYEFSMGLLPGQAGPLAETKITVHFVDTGVDTGPVIRQESVPIKENDSIDDLRCRGLAVEHQLYSEVLRLYAEGRIRIENGQSTIS